MIDFVYQTLAKFGYTHPLHPILIHVPVGMVIGAFLFALTSRIFSSTDLARTARHCSLLALIMLLPAALLGVRKQMITPFDKMPPFDYLTEEQMAALAAYLKAQ